jgi:hypothetical protein
MLFEGDGDVGIGGKPDLFAFDIRHQTDVDVVMVGRLVALTAILLGQLDAVAVNVVDSADVNPVGSDNFHVRLDLAGIHGWSLLMKELPTLRFGSLPAIKA